LDAAGIVTLVRIVVVAIAAIPLLYLSRTGHE
jgi:hypothetical protein